VNESCYFYFDADTVIISGILAFTGFFGSALTLLIGRQEWHLACKNGVVGCWHGIYLGRGADLHTAQLMPLPLTVSCSYKSRLVLFSWLYLSGTSSSR